MGDLLAWDLSQVFADDAAARTEAGALPASCRTLAERAAPVFADGRVEEVVALVAELGELEERARTLDDYARMRQYADAAGAGVQEIVGFAQAAAVDARAALAEALDAWCAIETARADGLLAEPALAPARYRLLRVRVLHRHRLSPDAERAWAAREESGRVRWASLEEQTEAAARIAFDDGTGERPWDVGSLWGVTRRPEADLRRRGYAAVAELFSGVADVVVACWDSAVADRLAEDRLRGHTHPAQATLDGEDLTLAGLESLVGAVWSHLPLRQALLRRQQELLGVDPVLPADADGEPPGLPSVTVEAAWATAHAALASLAPPLADQAAALRAAGRVDLDDRAGKQPYAVTFCTRLDPPAFLSTRFSGRAAHVTTVGHELGHAVALGTMRRAQPPIARGWPGVVVEVPSLLAEIATGDGMVEAAERRQRPALRLVAAQDLVWSIFESIAFCKVELDLYTARAAGVVLTTERVLAAVREHFAELFGPTCPFGERDALVFAAAWAGYAASYRFYNFQYSVGALCALALTARRRDDEKRFADDLLRFLAFGRSAAPADQLGVFGVELGSLALWEAGLDELERRLALV
jgi:oligoendopeptidase F